MAARREVVAEYESVCDEAGIHAGLVDVATLSVANLYLASGPPAGDWLIVHIRPEYTSIAIMRGSDLIFFRTRAEGDAEPLADVVHQTAMYYQDRLDGHGFSRVFAGGRSRLAGGVEAAFVAGARPNMDAQQDASPLDLALERLGARLGHACPGEHRRDAPGSMASRFTQVRGHRAGGDNRADAREHQRNRGDYQAAQFTKPRRRSRVFDVSAWRCIHLLGERAFLLVSTRDDRDLIPRHAERMQRARASRGRRSIRVETENERVRHRGYLTGGSGIGDRGSGIGNVATQP